MCIIRKHGKSFDGFGESFERHRQLYKCTVKTLSRREAVKVVHYWRNPFYYPLPTQGRPALPRPGHAGERRLAVLLATVVVVVAVLLAYIHTYIQSSPYFDPTHTRTGWIGQPPILDRLEVVTDNGDVDTLGQATP